MRFGGRMRVDGRAAGPGARVALVAAAVSAALLTVAVGVGAEHAEAKGRTVWLCKPGLEENPCKPGQATTRVSPTGATLGVTKRPRKARRTVDCFYVYPTVSDQTTPNANRDLDPEVRSIALYQAARYSRRCRVFAPVYRQLTLAAINGAVSGGDDELAFKDVRRAWRDYLKKYNRGRGFVLIGHSQGTFMLKRLLAERIESNRKVHRRLVSAILLGGDVEVRTGKTKGGDFTRTEACERPRQIGCVIAFATFNGPVPDDAVFGRTEAPGREVLCTNPAALRGGSAPLRSVYPSEPFAPGSAIGLGIGIIGVPQPHVSTPWIELRGAYSGRCSSADGANVLLITGAPGAPELVPIPNAAWGLHLVDANIALGNLIKVLRKQIAAHTG